MSVIKHNNLRRAVFNKPFTSCNKLEFVLGVMAEKESITQVELQKICNQEGVVTSGLKDNYLPILQKLGMIDKYYQSKTHKKANYLTITEFGIAYLNEVALCYAVD